MRKTALTLTVGALIYSLGLALAQSDDYVHMAGCDARRTGVFEGEFALPPALSWSFATDEKNPDAPIGAPAVGEKVIVVPVGSTLYGVDRETGEQKWKLGLGGKIFSTPTVVKDTVYVGVDNKQLVGVSLDRGQRILTVPTSGAVRTAPLYVDGKLYFGCDDHRVYAVDLQSQKIVWYFETRGQVRTTPAYQRETIYVASTDGFLYALSAVNGRQFWNTNLGSKHIFASPVVDRRRVIVASGERLLACDVSNGTVAWGFSSMGLISGSPAVKDRRVYVGSQDGSLYCLNAGNGQPLWRYPREGAIEPVSSAPVIHEETVLFRSGKRLLTALAVGDDLPDSKRLVWQYTLPPLPTAQGQPGDAMGPGMMPGAGMPMDPMGGMMGPPMQAPEPGLPGAGPGAGMGPGGAGALDPMGGAGGVGGPQVVEIRWEDSVDPSLVLGENGVYVLGEDHVLYGFDTRAADNSGPRVREALVDIQGKGGFQVRYQIVLDRGDTFAGRYADLVEIPGAPPIRVSVVLDDEGVGVNPATIQVRLNNELVETTYDARQALLWYVYEPAGAARSLRNGVQNMMIRAADWKGNDIRAQLSFTVDNSLPPPSPPQQLQPGPGGPGMDPGMPGMPGMPGGPMMPGMPGGMPPPPPMP